MLQLPKLTERAARAITRLMDTLPTSIHAEKYLPTVGWEVESNEPGFIPGPCIGLHPKEDVPPDLLLESQGVTVAYNLSDPMLIKHQGHLLDYLGGRFIFVDNEIVRFSANSGWLLLIYALHKS